MHSCAPLICLYAKQIQLIFSFLCWTPMPLYWRINKWYMLQKSLRATFWSEIFVPQWFSLAPLQTSREKMKLLFLCTEVSLMLEGSERCCSYDKGLISLSFPLYCQHFTVPVHQLLQTSATCNGKIISCHGKIISCHKCLFCVKVLLYKSLLKCYIDYQIYYHSISENYLISHFNSG